MYSNRKTQAKARLSQEAIANRTTEFAGTSLLSDDDRRGACVTPGSGAQARGYTNYDTAKAAT